MTTYQPIRYLAVGLMTMGLAACTADDDGYRGQRPVTPIAAVSAPATRSGTVDQEWPNGAEVAMKCVASTDNQSTAVGVTYKYLVTASTSQMLGSDATNTFFWDDGDMSFEAWYPYNGGTLPQAWGVPADQSSADLSAYDLLYANQTLTYSDLVTMTFHHQLARITVKLTEFINLYPGALTVTSVKIGTSTIKLSRTLTSPSASNGSASWTGGTGNGPITLQEVVANEEFTCLLPPQEISGSYIVVETSDGTFTCNDAQDMTVVSSQHKTYEMTLENNRIAVIRTGDIVGWKMISGVVASSKAWTVNGSADVWVNPWEEYVSN